MKTNPRLENGIRLPPFAAWTHGHVLERSATKRCDGPSFTRLSCREHRIGANALSDSIVQKRRRHDE